MPPLEDGDEQTPENAWFVYMILTDKNHLYTGIATDVDRRLQEHRDVHAGKHSARGAKFFRSQCPLRVVYTRAFADRGAASRHERSVKALSAQQKRLLIAGNHALAD